MSRVITYIDGFNLYFGMKEATGDKYLWLDVECLSKALIRIEDELVKTKYFTSLVTHDPPKEKRQKTFLEALQHSTSAEIYYGRYQFIKNGNRCRVCHSAWDSKNEKMTDVQIATQLLTDAFTDQFDRAILVSGDTDLIPPIIATKAHFPNKQIGVYFPPMRHSVDLQNHVDFHGVIGHTKLRDCQLPPSIMKPDGYILTKPITWV